jgi:hypothetical protein
MEAFRAFAAAFQRLLCFINGKFRELRALRKRIPKEWHVVCRHPILELAAS